MAWRRDGSTVKVDIDIKRLEELTSYLTLASEQLLKSAEAAKKAAIALNKATEKAANERRRPVIKNHR